MKNNRSMMLKVLVMAFAGALMTGGCEAPVDSACPTPFVDSPVEQPAADCAMPAAEPCKRYRIQLMGNPKDDLALRSKYIAAFGSACYMTDASPSTFNCYYKDPQKACADGVLVPEVFGAAAYDKNYPACVKNDVTGNYTRQVGPDIANVMTVYFEDAPRETPLIDVNGMATAVNGPYRDLPEPPTVKVGSDFYCPSGMFDANGKAMTQREYILEVNKKAHTGQVHSDFAGFTYPCKDDCGKLTICTEPLVLNGAQYKPDAPQVHHVVRRTDQRGCPWGTNSNRNAVVISGKLNKHLYNSYPSATEVLQVNQVLPYAP